LEYNCSEIANSADLNNDGNIDYEEYAKYLSSLNLTDLATAIRNRQAELMQERVRIDPNNIPVRGYTKAMELITKELKEETNFSKYPVEELLCRTDLSVKHMKFNYKHMFGFIDKASHKYKITVLSSMKAAILW